MTKIYQAQNFVSLLLALFREDLQNIFNFFNFLVFKSRIAIDYKNMKIFELLLLWILSTSSVKLPKMTSIEVKVGLSRKVKNSSKFFSNFFKMCLGVNIFDSRTDIWPYCSKILKKITKNWKNHDKLAYFDDILMIFSLFCDFFKILLQ